jgi:hypothetical protein
MPISNQLQGNIKNEIGHHQEGQSSNLQDVSQDCQENNEQRR